MTVWDEMRTMQEIEMPLFAMAFPALYDRVKYSNPLRKCLAANLYQANKDKLLGACCKN